MAVAAAATGAAPLAVGGLVLSCGGACCGVLSMSLCQALTLSQANPLQQLCHRHLALSGQGTEDLRFHEPAEKRSRRRALLAVAPLLRTTTLTDLRRPEAVALALQRMPTQPPHFAVQVYVLKHLKPGQVFSTESTKFAVVEKHNLVERELVRCPVPLLARCGPVVPKEPCNRHFEQGRALLHGDHGLPEERSLPVPLALLLHRGPALPGSRDPHEAEEAQEVVVADPAPWELTERPADTTAAAPADTSFPLVGSRAHALHHPARVAGAQPALGQHQQEGVGPCVPVLRLLLGLDDDAKHWPSTHLPRERRSEDVRRLPVEVSAPCATPRRHEHWERDHAQCLSGSLVDAGQRLEPPCRCCPIGQLRRRAHEPRAEELRSSRSANRSIAAVDHQLSSLQRPTPHSLLAAQAR
mmetsp:Transcript_42005/g.97245  ORF Transcript_42005/g.97245 Transcript_42005/m.97245 type:complete len:412 (+) Transcript_42005:360-1595(+)